MKITPLLLSGGQGVRLWPLSRQSLPKQLLPLQDDRSLLQNTLLRLAGLPQTDPIVVCNRRHRELVAEQLRTLGVRKPSLLLEPVGRGTALAVAVGALHLKREAGGGLLLVLPADHAIGRPEQLLEAARLGGCEAEAGRLVTFGVPPESPHSGYGYIRKGRRRDGTGRIYQLDRFAEKPAAELAKTWLDSGEWLWNSGIFLFDADVYLQELASFAPELHAAALAALGRAEAVRNCLHLDEDACLAAPELSVDIAVMERTTKGVVVPLDADWKDLGSWESLLEMCASPDRDGNLCCGEVLALDTRDCLLYSTGRRLVTAGVEQLLLVETEDAILVADRREAGRIRELVGRLSEEGREQPGAGAASPEPPMDAEMPGRAEAAPDCLRPGEDASPELPAATAMPEQTETDMAVPQEPGSRESLLAIRAPDSDGNLRFGEVVTLDTRDCLLYSSGRLLTTLGAEQLLVVETDKALLVADRRKIGRLGQPLGPLLKVSREAAVAHHRFHRPWGWYEVLLKTDGFQLKRLLVMPGECLSLQLHHQRSELWLFARGRGRVTRGKHTRMMEANESIYIPKQVKHQLANPCDEPVEVIEVQVGDYLGEDDIVRFQDKYGRLN